MLALGLTSTQINLTGTWAP